MVVCGCIIAFGDVLGFSCQPESLLITSSCISGLQTAHHLQNEWRAFIAKIIGILCYIDTKQSRISRITWNAASRPNGYPTSTCYLTFFWYPNWPDSVLKIVGYLVTQNIGHTRTSPRNSRNSHKYSSINRVQGNPDGILTDPNLPLPDFFTIPDLNQPDKKTFPRGPGCWCWWCRLTLQACLQQSAIWWPSNNLQRSKPCRIGTQPYLRIY